MNGILDTGGGAGGGTGTSTTLEQYVLQGAEAGTTNRNWPYANPRRYGATGLGVLSDRAAIEQAAANVAAIGGAITFSAGIYFITGAALNITVPVIMEPGAIIKPDAGVAFAFFGPTQLPIAQVFDESLGGSCNFAIGAVDYAYPDYWGAPGNVAPFDTYAVQRMFDSGMAGKFNRHYYATHVAMTNSFQYYDFNGYDLKAAATVLEDSLVDWQGYYCTIDNFSIDMQFKDTTVYRSAIHWFGDVTHQNPGNLKIRGCSIKNAIQGLVIGGFPGAGPGANVPLSESTIADFMTRGVERPIYASQPNGKIVFVGPQAVVSKNEWDIANPGIFNYATSYAVNNDVAGGASLTLLGGSVENNEAPGALGGLGLAGAGITCIGTVIEVVGTHSITGGMVLSMCSNDASGGAAGGVAGFTIAAGAVGNMIIEKCSLARASGSAAVDGKSLVDGTLSPGFVVDISDSTIIEWGWDLDMSTRAAHDSVPLVKGCLATLRNITYQTLAPAFSCIVNSQTIAQRMAGCDTSGASLAVAQVKTSPLGGWTGSFSAGSAWISGAADGPAGIATASVEVGAGVGEQAVEVSPQFPIVPGQTIVLRGWVNVSTVGGVINLVMLWYKFGGAAASVGGVTLASSLNGTGGTAALFGAGWQPILLRATAPSDAVLGALQWDINNGSTIRFTDVSIE